MPRLEVTVGPDRFHMQPAWVNHPSRPTEINTPLFAGRVLVFVRDFAGVTPDGSPPKRDAEYFEGRSRKFAILIEGRFKHRDGVAPYSGDEVQFGSDFDYLPDSFPLSPFNAGMKVAQWIDPATHHEFRPPHGRPYIMSPWSACVHTFAAYPSPSALSRAVVLSHHDPEHPHVDGAEDGSFVPTETITPKHRWVERAHWSFLGLKGDPRLEAFLAEHSELVLPSSGSGTPGSSSGLTDSHKPSALLLGTASAARDTSDPPARSDSPAPLDMSAGGAGLWGAPIPRMEDGDASGASTPAGASPVGKKKKSSRFSLSSLVHALDTAKDDPAPHGHDHVLTADQLRDTRSIGGRERAQSSAGAYRPDPNVAKELGPWRFADESVDAAEDTNFVFLDPSRPRTVAQRRKHFCRDGGKYRKEFTYDPDIVYAASFYAPFCDLNTFDLALGPVKMNIAEYFTKMPIRYTLRSTRLAPRPDGQEGPLEEEVFATISFRLVE
ncbi:hypothetical protein JCM3770_004858 [Rhodotorula araucariae]